MPGMPSPPRVLVVDDEAIIRPLIVINLALEGFEVHTAANGSEALAKAREVRPHVITSMKNDAGSRRLAGRRRAARRSGNAHHSYIDAVSACAGGGHPAG